MYEYKNQLEFFKILQNIPYIKNLNYLTLGFDIECYKNYGNIGK